MIDRLYALAVCVSTAEHRDLNRYTFGLLIYFTQLN